MWLDMRTKAWGARETQEYYRDKYCTIDIPRESANYLLDKDTSLVDNIHVGRLRAIHKQLETNE